MQWQVVMEYFSYTSALAWSSVVHQDGVLAIKERQRKASFSLLTLVGYSNEYLLFNRYVNIHTTKNLFFNIMIKKIPVLKVGMGKQKMSHKQ